MRCNVFISRNDSHLILIEKICSYGLSEDLPRNKVRFYAREHCPLILTNFQVSRVGITVDGGKLPWPWNMSNKFILDIRMGIFTQTGASGPNCDEE